MDTPILDIHNVNMHFPVRSGLFSRVVAHVHAVNDVSFAMKQGEVLGLVGESGCGKSTLGRVILQLYRQTSGEVYYKGQALSTLPRTRLHQLRRHLQTVFQDPHSSLNPRMTVGDTLREVLQVHHLYESEDIPKRIDELLEMVGLNTFHARRYPHEFSSGQRQRIGIARALAVEPEFLVCDEPVSALDVSIQAQILNLLMDLRRALNLTYLFISHDLTVVRHISDRIAVMYLGRIVELGDVRSVTERPLHPYTIALLSAAPVADPEAVHRRVQLGCDVPSPVNIPEGCPFHTRCPDVFAECRSIQPALSSERDGHDVACLKYASSWPRGEAVAERMDGRGGERTGPVAGRPVPDAHAEHTREGKVSNGARHGNG